MSLNHHITLLITGNIIWMVGQKYGLCGMFWMIWTLKHGTNTVGGMPMHSFMVILIGWKILKVIPNMRFGCSFRMNLYQIYYTRSKYEK